MPASIHRRVLLESRRGRARHLGQVGIRAKLRPLERAAFFKAYADKALKNMIQGGSGAFGNAATRLEAFVVKGGNYVYGNYPDIDALFQQQAIELDQKRRAAIWTRMQQLVHEKSIYAPIWLLASSTAWGPGSENPVRPDPWFRLHRAIRGHDAERLVAAARERSLSPKIAQFIL